MSDVPENALTLYERDGGLLWKHFDYETGKSDARRAREFVRQRAHPDRKVVTSRLLLRSCSGSSMSSGIGFFTRHAGHQKTMVSPGTLRPIQLGRVAVTEMGLPQGGRIAPALTPCLDCDELIAGVAIRGAGVCTVRPS
jgi:hypothetical protein